jgi:hypothetical protein
MPDMKLVVPALWAIAMLVLVAGSVGWLLAHPFVIVLSVAAIVALSYWRAARNRV